MADLLRRAILRSRSKMTIPTRIPKRHILTSSFTKQESFINFLRQRKSDYGNKNLPSVCLLIDRCSERNMPFSSLTVDSMVTAIEDRDDIISSMYYLHKFRHSESCYFLRPWTSQTWMRKCIEFDALDLALKALDESSQYGIFPDETTFCLLVDKCLKEEKHDLALEFASHMFLMETMESKLCQVLCLIVVSKVMEKEDSLNPTFSSLYEQRNFSGLCLRIGQLMSNKNLEILGLAKLGAIEKEHGIRSVYQEPWSPLMWCEGYLDQAIVQCENNDTPLSRSILNHLCDLVKDDDTKVESLNRVIDSLENQGLILEDSFIISLQKQYLPSVSETETPAAESFKETVDFWMAKHQCLYEVEREIEREQNIEREEFFESKRLEKLAKQMAIEKLGYWEFMSSGEEQEDVALHLRKDYVAGSSSDFDIENRIESKNI